MSSAINIKLKLRSLLRRQSKFYCITYDWDSREIVVHRSEESFIDELQDLKNNGMVKRAECYLDEPFRVNANE
jgi:hypothetical protein